MVSIVAKNYGYVVGVDTHARKHTLCLINNLGERLGIYECRVLTKDFRQVLSLIKRKTTNQPVLFAVEGTSSYGETLTRFLEGSGETVCEVRPPKIKQRGQMGKDDAIDAELAAKSVLPLSIDRLVIPRSAGMRKELRTLLSSRNLLVKQQTMNKNALNALVRSGVGTGGVGGIDARKALSASMIRQIARSRPCSSIDAIEAKRLSGEVERLSKLLIENEVRLAKIVQYIAGDLLSLTGVGPMTAAQFICSYSHKGRIRSPEAFVKLAGTAPIPASSGNTVRHRLNRFGDRALNCAINVVAMNRMRCDEQTKLYVVKRIKDGLSLREIRRTLKRYIARNIYKQLELLNLGID